MRTIFTDLSFDLIWVQLSFRVRNILILNGKRLYYELF